MARNKAGRLQIWPQEKHCVQCGKSFFINYWQNRRTLCSPQCEELRQRAKDGQTIKTVQCIVCGQPFQLGLGKRGEMCSGQCRKRRSNIINARNHQNLYKTSLEFRTRLNKWHAKNSAKNRETLSDSYIRQNLKLTKEQAPQALIEAKRAQLALHRLTRQFKHQNNNENTK